KKHPMGEISNKAQDRLSMIEFYYQVKNAKVASSMFKVSPKTLYKWLNRFEKSGRRLVSLEDESRSPKTKRKTILDFNTELNIKHLRERYIRLGKVKLQKLFEKEYGYFVSQNHIAYVIQKYNLYYDKVKARKIRSKKIKGKGAKKIKINEVNPNNYLSFEKPFFFTTDTIVLYLPYGIKRYILTAVEYEKKIAYARCYSSKSSLSTFDFLLRLFALVDGKIAAILSDNGGGFAKYFEEACGRLNITHIFTRLKTPKDNAVNERFNRTIQEEFMETDEYFEPYLTESNLTKANERLTEWLIFYNFKRPHQSLDYQTPIGYYNYKLSTQKLLPMCPTLTIS
ncbi:MAG: integrase core domain-containing protein, partial [Microgenomates group bacterium]